MPKIVDHDARRAALADAVAAVIRRLGLEQASIRTVAAEAGWSRGVIAHYFSNRDELLAFSYRSFIPPIGPVDAGDGDPRMRLKTFLLDWVPIDEKSRIDNEMWAAFIGQLRGHELLRRTVAEVNDEWIDAVRSLVEACVATGRYTAVLGVDETATFLSAFIDGLAVGTLMYAETYDRAVQERYVSFQLDGLLPPAPS